ncbi:MAG: hypothetical protein Q8920_03060 [Bacillota bacterium]|nr:hypothetical protein [Bacillota bacterium]
MRKFVKCTKALMLIFSAALILEVSMPLNAYAAASGSSITMAVKAGYDDTARVGASVPFHVAIRNKGSDISGEVQIILSTNPDTRTAYAQPVTLPKGTDKDILIYVPLNTANKKIEVRFVSGTKTIKTVNYDFKKLIPPETPVIAILSDDPNGFGSLGGMKIVQNMDPNQAYDLKQKMAMAASSAVQVPALSDVPVEIIPLGADSFPADIKTMSGFDILVISNFDTSSLSEKQKNTIQDWVEQGKTLYIGTGPNWSKVYNGLPDSLRPFKINGTRNIPVPTAIGKFCKSDVPSGNLNMANLTAGTGTIVISEGSTPISTAYNKGRGIVAVLSFDPSLSPISDWNDVQAFWKNLIIKTESLKNMTAAVNSSGGLTTSYNPYIDFQYLASSVPENQTPPFTLLIILLIIYILIAGPVIYILLKLKDKRDWNWLVIPVFALVFLGIIYMVGSRTRYTSAVLNNVSYINIDSKNQTADFTTWMGAFNNNRGSMKFVFDKDMDLQTNNNIYYDRGMVMSPQQQLNQQILSKYTFSDPPSYELYNVNLWEPRYVYTSNTKPFKGFSIEKISIDKGILTALIKNDTPYSMKESVMIIGNNYVDTGDIASGTEKSISVSVNSKDVKKKLDEFLDYRYGQPYMGGPGQKMPKDYAEKSRKRNIYENLLRNVLNYRYTNASGVKDASVLFVAMNYDDQGYNITVNGKVPKKYNTNVIFSNSSFNLEKGKHVEIPGGIINPVLVTQNVAFYDDPVSGGVRVQNDGDFEFKANMPLNIRIDQLKINWATVLPSYIKYQPKLPNGSQQQPAAKNSYRFYIYNYKTASWEEMQQQFSVSNSASYIKNTGDLKLKVSAKLDKNGAQQELLGIPEITLSGEVQ